MQRHRRNRSRINYSQALTILLSLSLCAGSPICAQLIPDQATLPPRIEHCTVIGTAAAFEVTFPEPPIAAKGKEPTAQRAMYILESRQFGQWTGVFLAERFPAFFANVNPQKRVLLQSATRMMRSYDIETFNHHWLYSECGISIRSYAVHPETGQHHAMQATLAPYRMLVQNVIHSGSGFNHIQTLGFFDTLDITAELPQWVGPLKTTMNGAFTVDLQGLEYIENKTPGSSKSFLAALDYDITAGRADRYEGEYHHPPLNEMQRTRLAAIHLALGEFYSGDPRDYEHDLRFQAGPVDYRIVVWEHFASAYHGLLPEIDDEDPVQRLALYTLIAVASENPPARRDVFLGGILLEPEKRDALFDAYDDRFADLYPVRPPSASAPEPEAEADEPAIKPHS